MPDLIVKVLLTSLLLDLSDLKGWWGKTTVVCLSNKAEGTEMMCVHSLTLTSPSAGWQRWYNVLVAAWPLFSGAGCPGSTPGSPAAESCTAALWSPDPCWASSCHSEQLPQTFAGSKHHKGDVQFKVNIRDMQENSNLYGQDFLTWISSARVSIAFGPSGIGPSSLSLFSKPETRPSTFLICFSRLSEAFALQKRR